MEVTIIKVIFLDFYGTVVYENGPISYEVIKRVFKSGNAKTPEELLNSFYISNRRSVQKNYAT
ncbi:hypothetical protein ASF12_14180 [Paenibacillus sp. Leaf72]|nr:hypothetical protein ASF12_14180 [Paenibacillus sp. Leaf72]